MGSPHRAQARGKGIQGWQVLGPWSSGNCWWKQGPCREAQSSPLDSGIHRARHSSRARGCNPLDIWLQEAEERQREQDVKTRAALVSRALGCLKEMNEMWQGTGTHSGLHTRLGRKRMGAVPGHNARGRCVSGTGARRRPRRRAAHSAHGRRSVAPMLLRAAHRGPTGPQLPGVCGRPLVLAGSRQVLRGHEEHWNSRHPYVER